MKKKKQIMIIDINDKEREVKSITKTESIQTYIVMWEI